MRLFLLACLVCSVWSTAVSAAPLSLKEVADRGFSRALLLGDETAIETHLAQSVDVNRPLYLSAHVRLRPLSVALCGRERSLGVVEYLLLQGASLQYQEPDDQDFTPLHRALDCSPEALRPELVGLLLRYGAFGNLTMVDRNGQTPLALAESFDPLLARQLKAYQPPEMVPFQLPSAPTAYHKGGQQLQRYQLAEQLLEAVTQGDKEQVALLLAQGADLQTHDLLSTGDSLLMLALRQGHGSVAESLLTAGAELRATNWSQEQAIHIAAAQGNTLWLDRLHKAGASIFARDIRGWTPLHWAALRGQAGSVKWLLSRNANPRAVGHQGETAADLAKDIQQAVQYGFVNSKDRAAVLRLLQQELQQP